MLCFMLALACIYNQLHKRVTVHSGAIVADFIVPRVMRGYRKRARACWAISLFEFHKIIPIDYMDNV